MHLSNPLFVEEFCQFGEELPGIFDVLAVALHGFRFNGHDGLRQLGKDLLQSDPIAAADLLENQQGLRLVFSWLVGSLNQKLPNLLKHLSRDQNRFCLGFLRFLICEFIVPVSNVVIGDPLEVVVDEVKQVLRQLD